MMYTLDMNDIRKVLQFVLYSTDTHPKFEDEKQEIWKALEIYCQKETTEQERGVKEHDFLYSAALRANAVLRAENRHLKAVIEKLIKQIKEETK